MSKSRVERDLLGEEKIPADAYWGIHTLRAVNNFRMSGYPVNPVLIESLAAVKKAACLANAELGYLEARKAEAIETACDEISGGRFQDQFPLDALQGGAGTSTNMNMNEVIANRAIEILGGEKGDYRIVHPIEDVNRHQSTNDVYPTALKIACIRRLRDLSREITATQAAFQKKEKEFASIVKIGRTELQEAVPITLGVEFGAFAEAIARDRWRTFKSEERLRTVNAGGTAVGTGLTAPRAYIFLVIEKLREVTGMGLSRAENVLDATANTDCFVEVSGILNAHACNLIKISGDLRILHLLGEIGLPALQAGSSIMPGKVNPVILEAVIQSALAAIPYDRTVTEACSRSTLQINEFMPLLSWAMLGSLDLLCAANRVFAGHIAGIRANEEKCREYFDRSPGIITALLPHLGYEKAEALLKEFEGSGKETLKDFLVDKLGKDLIEKTFAPSNLTSLGYK